MTLPMTFSDLSTCFKVIFQIL